MSCKFSIIVPLYNAEKHLNDCISSLVNQNYKNVEIILVDDGSSDNSRRICSMFASSDHRIKVINKTNGGPASARKAGAEIVTGDYIVCVDADDFITENCIYEFSRIIDRYNPDIVCSGYFTYGKYEQRTVSPALRSGFYSREDIVREVFPVLIQGEDATYFPPSLWAKAFRRELLSIELQEVDNRIFIGEDSACVIPSIFRATSMYVTPMPTYYYRTNETSLTKNRKAFRWEGPLLIDQHLRSRIDARLFDFEEQMCRKLTHELFTVVVSQFYRNDGYSDIIKDIKEKLKIPVYQDAVDKSVFRKSLKAMMMSSALKRGWMLPIYLYSKLKR